MVEKIRLSGNRYGLGGQQIPTLRPEAGTIGAVQSVQPVAEEAMAQGYAQQASRLGQMSATFSNIADNAYEQEMEYQKREAKAQLELDEKYSQLSQIDPALFQTTAIQNDVTNAIAVAAQNTPAGDVGSFENQLAAFTEETLKDFPEEEGKSFLDLLTVQSGPQLEQLNFEAIEMANETAKAEASTAVDSVSSEIIETATMDSPAKRVAFTAANAKLDAMLEAAGFTPTEKTLYKTKMEYGARKVAIGNMILQSPQPLLAAIDLSTSGQLPPDIASEILGLGQQIHSARQQVLDSNKAARAAARELDWVNNQKAIILDPLAPEAGVIANDMLTNAQSASELKRAMDSQKFVKDRNNARYKEDDVPVASTLEFAILTGDINPEAIRDRLNTYHGNGISTGTYKRLNDLMDARQSDLLTSVAFDTFKLEAQNTLPKAFGGSTKTDILALALSGQPITAEAFGSGDAEATVQTQAYRNMLVEMNEAVMAGDIKNQKELLEFGRERLRMFENKKPTPPANPLPFSNDLSKLSDGEKKSFQANMNNQQLIQKATKYKDLESLQEDLKNGVITREEYAGIYSLILPQLRAQ